MSRFYKTIFLETPATASELSLFAFGKHPGWNDHIEGLGIHNETLALFHSVFYVNGIRAVIDSGVWEKSDSVKLIPGFGNLILWQGRKSFLACRMWPSKDGKGRGKYPMIIGVFGGGVSLLQAFPRIAPMLEKLETSCKATRTETELREVMDQTASHLKSEMGSLRGGEVVPLLSGRDFEKLFRSDKMRHGAEGWLRILYSVNNQFQSFAKGSFKMRETEPRDGQHLRVPLLDQNEALGMLDWLRFFRGEIDSHVPIFLSTSHGRPWCDLIVGEPDPRDFSCLKLNQEGIPLVNEIPYNIPESFQEGTRNIMVKWEAEGADETPILLNTKDGSEAGEGGGKGNWFRKFFRGS